MRKGKTGLTNRQTDSVTWRLAFSRLTSSIQTTMRPKNVKMKEFSWIYLNLLEFTWIYVNLSFWKETPYGWTDGPADRPTDQRTDRRTKKPLIESCVDASKNTTSVTGGSWLHFWCSILIWRFLVIRRFIRIWLWPFVVVTYVFWVPIFVQWLV